MCVIDIPGVLFALTAHIFAWDFFFVPREPIFLHFVYTGGNVKNKRSKSTMWGVYVCPWVVKTPLRRQIETKCDGRVEKKNIFAWSVMDILIHFN